MINACFVKKNHNKKAAIIRSRFMTLMVDDVGVHRPRSRLQNLICWKRMNAFTITSTVLQQTNNCYN